MSQPLHTGGGTAVPLYFCHKCDRTVDVTPSSELTCAQCNETFIEELENPNPNPNTFFSPFDDEPPFSRFTSSGAIPLIFSRSGGGSAAAGGMDFQNLGDLSALFGPGPMSRPGGAGGGVNVQNPGEFNPFAFVQNYINQLREGGANIQFVIENQNDGGGGGGGLGFDPFRSSFGDYYFGPGLEQLIQQLAENDPNRYGTPPAAKSAIEKLPNVKITKELLESDYSDCAVCKDSFGLDEELKQLPCKHMYHNDCILPWLELHNSCPVCRYELPTDDQDYENRSRQGNPSGVGGGGGSGGGGLGGGSQVNPPTPRTAARRFSINLPWPFGSPAETSNSGSGNNNSGAGNQGTDGGGGAGGQARQEDLD